MQKMINRFFPSTPILKHVGRWKPETCNATINHKVDLSNFDHCEPCGQYNVPSNRHLCENPPIVYKNGNSQQP